MSKQFLDRLKECIVVFDIDGVLAAYEFGDFCHTTPEWGPEQFKSIDDNPYVGVSAVPVLQEFIKEMPRENVYVCSVASEEEVECKAAFVTRNYEIDREKIVFVDKKDKKLQMLLDLKAKFPGKEIAIVDDTVKTLDNIWLADNTIRTIHVSSFFC